MPPKRDIVVVAIIVSVMIALTLPSYADYSAHSRVAAALNYTAQVENSLQAACASGTFAGKSALSQLAIPERDLNASVARGELSQTSPSVARMRTVVTDIYGRPFFGLFPWKVILEGSTIDFEYSCTDAKVFSARFIGSTIEPKYLPATMRSQ